MINRTIAPELSQVKHIKLAEPTTCSSASGIPFYFIENIPEDVVKLTLQFAAGKIHQTHLLQSVFTTDLLLSGTPTKSQNEIQESIDFYGGYVQCDMAAERSSVTIYALNKNIEAIYAIVFDALINANFPENEFEQHRTIEKQKFIVSLEKNASKARKYFMNSLFAGTPFDSNAAADDFDKITREQCIDFHKYYFLNGLVDVNIIGNLSETFKQKLMNQLDALKNKHVTNLTVDLNPRIGLMEEKKEGSLQTAIRIGRPLFTPEHSDYMAFDVLNTLLGGYFGSRLMSNIREDKGYTYGIGSGVASMKSLGYFFISTEVGVDVKEATLQEIKNEIERLQTELVDEDELNLVRNYMIGQLLKSTDGPFAMMNQFLFLNMYSLDANYFDRYIQTIEEITPEQLQTLAQTYLNWDSFSIVTVG